MFQCLPNVIPQTMTTINKTATTATIFFIFLRALFWCLLASIRAVTDSSVVATTRDICFSIWSNISPCASTMSCISANNWCSSWKREGERARMMRINKDHLLYLSSIKKFTRMLSSNLCTSAWRLWISSRARLASFTCVPDTCWAKTVAPWPELTTSWISSGVAEGFTIKGGGGGGGGEWVSECSVVSNPSPSPFSPYFILFTYEELAFNNLLVLVLIPLLHILVLLHDIKEPFCQTTLLINSNARFIHSFRILDNLLGFSIECL